MKSNKNYKKSPATGTLISLLGTEVVEEKSPVKGKIIVKEMDEIEDGWVKVNIPSKSRSNKN